MPSWIEQLAWVLPCPTCQAEVDMPCVWERDRAKMLEFNHVTRNAAFHEQRERERQTARGGQPGHQGQQPSHGWIPTTFDRR